MTRPSARPDGGAGLVARGAAVVYRLLLVSYPRAFRVAHGEDAASLFGEACQDDWSHGRVRALARRVIAAFTTVPVGGVAERRAQRRATHAGASEPAFRFSAPGLLGDLRYAIRSIRRRPMLSATIAGTLAIGIGTNTAAFSVIDATLLRPTPYVDAGRVVLLEAAPASGKAHDPKVAWARTWVAASRSIARVEARRWRSALITGAGSATRKRIIEATSGYLPAIGARPIAGRLLVPADSLSGAPPVAVIASTFWRSQFGQRPDVVGTTIGLDGIAHQIVGVASEIESDIPGLRFSLATALADAAEVPVDAVAWLRPGVSLEAARADVGAMAPLVDGAAAVRPRLSLPDDGFWRITVFRTIELGLIAASLLLIAIAGVNVVNLLLAAGETRLGELAVRRAFGASPGRVIRLLLIETAVLTLAGAAIGLGIAWTIVRALAALDAGAQLQTQLERIRLDPVVIGYTVAIALVTTIAVGLMPALRGARVPSASIREGGTRSVSRLRRAGSTLVAVETALSALLLVAAGVVGHAFLSMHFADRGFDADRVLGVRIALPADKYATPASRAAFLDALVDDVSRRPDVEQAGIGYGAKAPADFVVMGQWSVAGSSAAPIQITAAASFVRPGYFALMGIPLLQGTDFTTADAAESTAPVQPAIVSRSLVRRFWGDGNAVGAVFEIASAPRAKRYRVIGVSGDVSVWGLLSPTCRDCDMQVYAPLPDVRQYTDVLLRVRPGVPLPATALALRTAVARLDPDVPSDDGLETAEEALSRFIRVPRFTAALFSVFAGLAVLLVAVGLAAVVSHSVVQRTREMGIRMALGAAPGGVRRLVIVQGLRPTLVGLAAGLVLALLTTRFLGALLYGMSPTDPITLVGAPLVLIAIALAALVVPAVRATRVDPLQALRTD
jgi:putative ABC transport system permease protein